MEPQRFICFPKNFHRSCSSSLFKTLTKAIARRPSEIEQNYRRNFAPVNPIKFLLHFKQQWQRKIIFRFSVEKKIFTFHYLPFARQQPKHFGKRELRERRLWGNEIFREWKRSFYEKNHRWERKTNSSLLIFHNNFLIDKVQPFSVVKVKLETSFGIRRDRNSSKLIVILGGHRKLVLGSDFPPLSLHK